MQRGVSDVLKDWEGRFDNILEDVLSFDVPSGAGSPCKCGKQEATVRCRDCFQARLECTDCLSTSHCYSPFHWIDVWNGDFLEKQDMSFLDFVLFLGHDGEACPFIRGSMHPLTYTVTHTNGIHRVRVHECWCPRRRDTASQLLRAGLFPATLERPESAFTFDLLRQWDLHFLSSKKSAYDYFEALRRLTDNSGTRTVKVYLNLLHSVTCQG